MDSPVRKMLKRNDYNRHKLFRKIKRRRKAQIEQESKVAEKELKRRIRWTAPKFDDGKPAKHTYKQGSLIYESVDPVTGDVNYSVNDTLGNEVPVYLEDNTAQDKRDWIFRDADGNIFSRHLEKPTYWNVYEHDKPLLSVYPEFALLTAGRAIANGVTRAFQQGLKNLPTELEYVTNAATDGTLKKVGTDLAIGTLGANAVDLASLNIYGRTWGEELSNETGLPTLLTDFTNPGWFASALSKPILVGLNVAHDVTKSGIDGIDNLGRKLFPTYDYYKIINETNPKIKQLNPIVENRSNNIEPNGLYSVDFNTARKHNVIKQPNKKIEIGDYTIDDFVDQDGNINNHNVVNALRQFRDMYGIDLKQSSHVHERTGTAGISEPYQSSLRHMFNAAKTAQTAPVAEGSTKQRLVFNALVHDIGEFIDRLSHGLLGAYVVKGFMKDMPEESYNAIKDHMSKEMLDLNPETQALHFADVASGLDYNTHVKNATYANYRKLNPVTNISYDRDGEPVRDVLKNKINPILKQYGLDTIDLNLTEEEARKELLDRIKENRTFTRGARDPRESQHDYVRADKDKIDKLLDAVRDVYNIPKNEPVSLDDVEKFLSTYITTEKTGHGTLGWGPFHELNLITSSKYGPLYTSNSDLVSNGYASETGDAVLNRGSIWHGNLPIILDENMSLTDLWLANEFPLYNDTGGPLSDFFNFEVPFRLKTGRSLKQYVGEKYNDEIKQRLDKTFKKLKRSEVISDDRFFSEPSEYIDPETGERLTQADINDFSDYQSALDMINYINETFKKYFPNSDFELNPIYDGKIHNPKELLYFNNELSMIDDLSLSLKGIDENSARLGMLNSQNRISAKVRELNLRHIVDPKQLAIVNAMLRSEIEKVSNTKIHKAFDHVELLLNKDIPPFGDNSITTTGVIDYIRNTSEEELSNKLYDYFLKNNTREKAFPVKVSFVNGEIRVEDVFSTKDKSIARRMSNRVSKLLKLNENNLHDIFFNTSTDFSDEFVDKINTKIDNILKNEVYNIKERYFENILRYKKESKKRYALEKQNLINKIISEQGTDILQEKGINPLYLTDDIQKHVKMFTTEKLRPNVSKAALTKSKKRKAALNKTTTDKVETTKGYLHYIAVGKYKQLILENPVKVSDKNTKALRSGSRSHVGPTTKGLSKKVRALVPPILLGTYMQNNRNK